VRRELRHDLSTREPSVAQPRPPPKLTSKQLAVKMFSRAPPPIVPSMVFDEEEETPNSGMRSCLSLPLLFSRSSCKLQVPG
jgi:hypothetical protein